jgi:hypothetical protein
MSSKLKKEGVGSPKAKNRKAQVYLNGKWVRCDFECLEKGDVFMLFEPNGKTVYGQGEFEYENKFVAVSDPYLNDHGVWTIEADHNHELS